MYVEVAKIYDKNAYSVCKIVTKKKFVLVLLSCLKLGSYGYSAW